MAKQASAYGIYPDRATVNDAIGALQAAGFRVADISVLLPDNIGTKDFAHEKHSKAPEGAVGGGSTGGIIGAALGWLAGAGSLMVPGFEHLHAAGPMIATLSGLGAGAVLGGITGGLMGMGIPEYEAKRYMGRIRRGGILMSVHCVDMNLARTALGVLKRTGAVDTGVRPESRTQVAREEKPLPRAS